MIPRSHSLFHFTKGLDPLKSILKNGFRPSYCLEDVRWLKLKGSSYFAFPMVCFCDLPLSRINDHVEFYGKYGLGLTREWAKLNKLSPVSYLTEDGCLAENFRASYWLTGADESRKRALRYSLAYLKPIEGNMLISNKSVKKAFIQESEWRYVPSGGWIDLGEKYYEKAAPYRFYAQQVNFREYMSKKSYEMDFTREKETRKVVENYSLKFMPEDLNYIFVESDSDIQKLINYINSDLNDTEDSIKQFLIARIFSLESLIRDI